MLDPIKIPISAQDMTGTAFRSVELKMKGLQKASDFVKNALRDMAAPLTIAGIAYVGKSALDAADNINDMSKRLGLSTEALSQYNYVAKMTGTDFETMANAVKFSQRAVSEAANGSKEAAKAIASLGLNAAALRQMSPEEAFEAIGGAISKLGPAADRTAVSMKLLGRSGIDILPAFENGVEGFRAMRVEADKAGQTISALDAEMAAAANDSIDKMTMSFQGLGRVLAISVAPGIKSAADALSKFIASGVDDARWKDLLEESKTVPQQVQEELGAAWLTGGRAGGYEYWKGFKEASAEVRKGLPFLMVPDAPGLLPGMTDDGRKQSAAQRAEQLKDQREAMLAGLKDATVATDGLTEAERRYFQALEASVQLAQTRQAESDHQEWLVDQLGPTDDQAADEAAAALERHYRAVQQAADEYERLKQQSQVTWQLMAAGINEVADQLSNNLAAAITGARVKLLDLASLAETILSMAFRYAIGAAVGAIFPAAPIIGGGIGPGIDGVPLGGVLKSAGGTIPVPGPDKSGGTTIVQHITVNGKIDPNDKLTVRRLATVLYDETLKIQKHHGPMGVTA